MPIPKKSDSARFDKNKIRRDLERDAKQRYRETLKRLAHEAGRARLLRKEALALQKSECAKSRLAALQQADDAYREAKRLASEARAAHGKHARMHCDIERAFLRGEKDAKIADAKDRLDAERAYQRSMKAIARSNKQRSAERSARTKRAERLSESDDAVRANIEPHLIALWEQVKKQIRGTERISRTEAFLQYVEEHPEELWEVQERAVERELAELAAQADASERPKKKRLRRVQTQFSTPFGAALIEDAARSRQEPLNRPRSADSPPQQPPPLHHLEDGGDRAPDPQPEAVRETALAAFRSAAEQASEQKLRPTETDRAILRNMLDEPGSFPGSHLAEKRLLHAGYIEPSTGGYPLVTIEGAAFAASGKKRSKRSEQPPDVPF